MVRNEKRASFLRCSYLGSPIVSLTYSVTPANLTRARDTVAFHKCLHDLVSTCPKHGRSDLTRPNPWFSAVPTD